MKLLQSAISLVFLVAQAAATFPLATSAAVEERRDHGALRALKPAQPPVKTPCSSNVILPRFDQNKREIAYAGKTYEEWANRWVYWRLGFNSSTRDPFYDTTGIYAHLNQPSSNMYLLPGTSGGPEPLTRSITLPQNKMIYGTFCSRLVGFVVGKPLDEDSTYLKGVLGFANVTAQDNSTFVQLFSLAAKAYCDNLVFTGLKITVDNCKIDPFQAGVIWTKPEHAFVLPANPRYGIPTNNLNAVQCSFGGIFKPLKKGKHTIKVTGKWQTNKNPSMWQNVPFSPPTQSTFNVTYHITVV